MATHDSRGNKWHMKLADILDTAQDGDEVIVETDAARLLGEVFVQRKRPGLEITFTVQAR